MKISFDINLEKIPSSPGCYFFLDESKKIIYVGKAKDLRKRVTNYFTKKDHDHKTQIMIEQIKGYDFIATNTEVEALILENNLIKKNSPKYNIDLKDSKRYAYLELTNEKFPRLIIARKTKSDGKLYGPFTSGQKRDYIMDFLIKNFKIRTCSVLPKKPCLRYHIGLCDAPCVGLIDEKDYMENIKAAEMVLNGKTHEIIKMLEVKMKEYSKNKNYESAQVIKNKIEALEYLEEKQNMERQKKYDEDVINYVVKQNKVHLILFNVHRGILENKRDFEFDFKDNFFEEFIVQYYSENPIPQEIIVPEEVDNSLEEYLTKIKGKNVKFNVAKKGEKKDLLELVLKNIELNFFIDEEKLVDLQKRLNMQNTPKVIECFDISHLSGTSTVASMVQFRNAKPYKQNYRRFKIRSVSGIDDFASIAEVVRRRYKKLIAENQRMPDLIIIDGGIGQLNFALNELKKLNLKIPIISIAKQFEEIYTPEKEKPLKLDKTTSALKLIQNIRDEAHRFAIKYNRLLRSKEMVGV